MFLLLFFVTALAEIGGCFAFWTWARLGRSPWWLVPGLAALLIFAYLTTRVDSPLAGRAYAAYGGIYIVTSLLWMWLVEQSRPDRWDVIGATLCVIGTISLLYGRRLGL
jgi:small multidrug resistance family-3 protein